MRIRVLGRAGGNVFASQSDLTGTVMVDSSTGVQVSLPNRPLWMVIPAEAKTRSPGMPDVPPTEEPSGRGSEPIRPTPTLERRSAREIANIEESPFFARR